MKIIKYLFACILISIFLIQFSSASDWIRYGNGFSPLWQSQVEGTKSLFDDGYSTSFSGVGYTPRGTSYGREQVLVSLLNDTEAHLIVPNNNYFQVYNDNLILLGEIFVGGTIVSQYDTADFDSDGNNDDILGIFNFNNTYHFRAYTYNITSDTFTFFAEHNFSGTNYNYVQGLRGNGIDTYAVMGNVGNKTADFVIMSWNGTAMNVTTLTLPNWTFTPPSEFFSSVAWLDMDNDGRDEYLIYTEREILVFERDGTIDSSINITGTIHDVRILRVDNTVYKKLAVFYSSKNNHIVTIYRLDGSVVWTKTFATSVDTTRYTGNLAIESDYDGDVLISDNEIYVANVYFRTAVGTFVEYRVLKGYDGTVLTVNQSVVRAGTSFNKTSSLTIADMNNNGIKDFIFSYIRSFPEVQVFDPNDNVLLVDYGIGTSTPSCIPADLTLDGLLEVICSDTADTTIFLTTAVNQNAYITSVTYDPSITITVNSTLFTYITATDPESDSPLYYSIKCNNSASFSSDTTSNTQSCYFDTLGIYNVTVRVRDPFHSTYDSFSQYITVTQSGVVCDNDDICEAEQGETYYTCPHDCPYSEDTIQTEGGVAIPTKIVDTENYERGLLPEIYYGMIGFFSNILEPVIILGFLILGFALIFTFVAIFRKLIQRAL